MPLGILMRLSQYFMPILRDDPKEAEIVSHKLMLRAGMVRQEAAGSYSWLPMGFRVLKKIEQIVREEQDRAGAIEVLMPTLQSADLWRKSGRYDDYGKEMLRIKDRQDRDMLFGPTNEEMITDIFRTGVQSYKDMPRNLYHIQWKFRDEVRPRFGVMRGREFLMKDAYSFDVTREAGQHAYNKMFVSYLRTFARMGLKAVPMRADTGPWVLEAGQGRLSRHERRTRDPRAGRLQSGPGRGPAPGGPPSAGTPGSGRGARPDRRRQVRRRAPGRGSRARRSPGRCAGDDRRGRAPDRACRPRGRDATAHG